MNSTALARPTSRQQMEILNFIDEVRKLTPTLCFKDGFNLPLRRKLREMPAVSGNRNFQIIDLEAFNLPEPSLIVIDSREREIIYVEAGSTLGMNNCNAWEFFDIKSAQASEKAPYDTLCLRHMFASERMRRHAESRTDHRYFVYSVNHRQITEILSRLNSRISGLLVFEVSPQRTHLGRH